MTRSELIQYLSSIDVHNSSYAFDRIKNSECVSILKEGEIWKVYYTERNIPDLLFQSGNEALAYDFVAGLFKDWMGL
ncbi:MAG: hypothetical protein ACN6NW_11590 [Acinetobacter amyesii]|uniref:hypothetical protein n=1 Tax=Acinetobacter TaxID=469 RepID=UPI003D0492C0